jgi:hypothetical protein
VEIPKHKLAAVRLYTAAVAVAERVALDDPRIEGLRQLAEPWIEEGMGVREAVALARDLAFRRHGLPDPAHGTAAARRVRAGAQPGR